MSQDRPRALTEAEAERTPDAIAGRALLEERLTRLTPEQLDAFRAAVARCYGGGASDGG